MKWNGLCLASCELLIQSWADRLQEHVSHHPITPFPTYHTDMRTPIQEPWGSQPLWRKLLGPQRAVLAAKLHTQHVACKSSWVFWQLSSLMMPLFCKRIIAKVRWLALLSLNNSAATPEIDFCPILLTALKEHKTLQTPRAGKEVTHGVLAPIRYKSSPGPWGHDGPYNLGYAILLLKPISAPKVTQEGSDC